MFFLDLRSAFGFVGIISHGHATPLDFLCRASGGVADDDCCSNLMVSRSSSNAADHDGVDSWELSRNSSNSADDDADVFDAELGGKPQRRRFTCTKHPFNPGVRQYAQPVGPYPRRSPQHTGSSTLDISCAALRTNLIGRLSPVETPFGSKPLVCEFHRGADIATKSYNKHTDRSFVYISCLMQILTSKSVLETMLVY